MSTRTRSRGNSTATKFPVETDFDPKKEEAKLDVVLKNLSGDANIPLLLQTLVEMVKRQTQIISTLQEQQKQLVDAFQEAKDVRAPKIDLDLKERNRSIVAYGVKESDAPTNRGKFMADKVTVARLLDVVDAECDAVQVYRMSKSQKKNDDRPDNRPRLLKIVLPSSFHRDMVLKNAKKLKNSEFQGVFIRPSMTKEERDADYLLRQQLRELRAKKDGNYYYISKGAIEIAKPRNSVN